MKMNARWYRLCLCALIGLATPSSLLLGEALVNINPLLSVPAGKDANDPNRFRVSGVVYMTGTPVALLTDTVRSWSWFVWGNMTVDRYNIREITSEQVVLIERGSGRELRLPVATAAPGGPTPFTKEWIHSKANPMLGHPVPPPRELYEDWPNATDADKAEIAGFYEKYGWKLARAEIVAGAVDFAWEWLYEADRIAAAKAKRESFLNLLSPEQKQIWQMISSGPNIYAVEGKFTEEQQKLSAERETRFADFQSTLTAEQKAAFEGMRAHPVPSTDQPTKKPEYSLPRLLPDDPANSTGPARYTKAWINSRANPMLHYRDPRLDRDAVQDGSRALRDPSSHPDNIFRNWIVLSIAERTQVVEFYQKHGWQLLHIETVSGNTGVTAWRNIYEKERIRVLKAKREAFVSLLSPDQQMVWKTGAFNRTVFIADGKPDYARNRNPPEQQKIFEQFWSSLDTAQKAAYADLHDFTKADWN